MTSKNDEKNSANSQISVQHSTLTDVICCEPQQNSEREGYSDEQSFAILTKPVRLSAFLKELEEAENEPIPEIRYSYNEEIPSEDEELSELKNVEVPKVDNVEFKDNVSSHEDDIIVAKKLTRPITSNQISKWSITPARQLHYNNFLTPNISNINRQYHLQGSFTQIQDKKYCRIQCDKLNITESSSNRISLLNLNKSSSKKKALFLPRSNTTNDVIYEEHGRDEENENKNPKVLCTIPTEQLLLEPFEKIIVNKIEYIILNQIGRGGSSVIFHCYNPSDKCERAIKRVSLTGDKICVDGYINEVQLLSKLQKCDRIIKMFSYEIKKDEKILLMVLEKGERDLAKILKELSNNTEHLPMYMLLYYWMEMLYAVKQIHNNSIIHSDLKPANFLMVSSKLKLIDFGIASSLQNDMTSVVKNIQVGSFNYISPEALINNSKDDETAKFKLNFKSDVWSLGCILYQLTYRKTPFQHIGHTYAKLSAIIDPKHVIDYPDAPWVPQNIVKTIKSCLQYDVKLRPSVDELIKYFENMYD